jgi:hypothetical protein
VNRVSIKSDGTPEGTYVVLDGVQLNNVQAVNVDIVAGELPIAKIKLDVYLDELIVDGAVNVYTDAIAARRITDLEAIERVINLCGTGAAQQLIEELIKLVATKTEDAKRNDTRSTLRIERERVPPLPTGNLPTCICGGFATVIGGNGEVICRQCGRPLGGERARCACGTNAVYRDVGGALVCRLCERIAP